LSGSTTKKVVLARFDREPIRGFVNPNAWVLNGAVDLLTPSGAATPIPLDTVKAVCFVRDLDGPAIFTERTEFRTRPKSMGLWVELLFRDGDRLEGMIPNNLLGIEEYGLAITPPDAAGNTQRVFAPRPALKEVNVIGVIGVPKKRTKEEEERQIQLF
jgi:hypothetical protein